MENANDNQNIMSNTIPISGINKQNLKEFKKKDVKLNQLFINFYREALQMNTKEYENFLENSVKKLPITFRINKMNAYCDFIETEITKFIMENCKKSENDNLFLTNISSDKKIQSPSYNRYNWNSLNNIFTFKSVDKKIPANEEYFKLLKMENDNGILRQELVSMIPVSLVEIKDDNTIMDMCAAPGNKSVQILEIMAEKARENGVLPSGLLVANEILQSRADKLINFLQAQPAINVLVTKCQAENFPVNKNFSPDIIFCDVPCSGDGTTRKNKGIRKRWKPSMGLVNHRLQVKILEKALVLCQKGGRVVYSTCAINPLENEAVVAYLLEKYRGYIELEDCKEKVSKELDLKFSEGMVKWKVPHDWKNKDNNIEWVHEYSNKDPLNLRRCLRFYSHQNDSGSFFVAVIKKFKDNEIDSKIIDPLNNPLDCSIEPNEKNIEQINSKLFLKDIPLNDYKNISIKDDFEELCKMFGKTFPEDQKIETEHSASQNLDNQRENNEKSEEAQVDLRFDKYVKLKEYQNSFEILIDFFGIKNEVITNSLYTSRHTSAKILLFSKKLAEIIPIFADMNLNMQYAGLLAFDKNKKNTICKYRLSYLGTLLLEKYIDCQKIELDVNDQDEEAFFKQILNIKKVRFEDIIEKIRNKILECKEGTVIITFDNFVINARKGKNNLNVMIPENKLNNIIIYLNKYFFNN